MIVIIQLLYMEIVESNQNVFTIAISDKNDKIRITFNPESKELFFLDGTDLTVFLKANEYQFRKLLHNKRPVSFYVGFKLKFSIIDGKDVASYNDRNNIVVVDGIKHQINVIKKYNKRKLIEVFTDGSFNEQKNIGAYALLFRDIDGNYEEYSFLSNSKSSSLIELEAVIKALELAKTDLRIITDSQYVRKGITEWIVHWKLNEWTTANGTKAKNIEKWKYLDNLCNGRYIEFEWVKAHSNHFENDYCDIKSKEMTNMTRRKE